MDQDQTIRIINDPPLDGPSNMARDEALMTLIGAGESRPTLRLYQWYQPTISLGYFQPFSQYEMLPEPLGALPVVRRLTGGGAILHDQELTYSLSISTNDPLVNTGANRLYELMHKAIILGLGDMGIVATSCGSSDDSSPTRGPFFCFDRRHGYDVIVGTDKIAGSAQRRTRLAIMQHGSIVTGDRFKVQAATYQHVLPANATDQLRGLLQHHCVQTLGRELQTGSWETHEFKLADELMEKYRGLAWTSRA